MNHQRNKVVYTAVFGNYDNLKPVNPEWSSKFICFTDNLNPVSNGWEYIIIPIGNKSPTEMNRFYKILPHHFLSNYNQSLYLDGNIKLNSDPSFLFEKYLSIGNISIPKHKDRNCLYLEGRKCIDMQIVDKAVTLRQLKKYADSGFPRNFGMTENNIILRNHNNEKIIELMEDWWQEFTDGGKRDQISLPFLIWKNKIDVIELKEGPRSSEKLFELTLHATEESMSFIQRFARVANGRKHLNWQYYILSKIVEASVFTRDIFRKL